MIELLVVVAIIGILGGVVYVSGGDARAIARDKTRVNTLKQVQLALDIYYERTGEYPPGIADPPEEGTISCSSNFLFLSELVDMGLFGTVVEDPLNREPYRLGYAVSEDQEEYVLVAYLEKDTETAQSDGGYCDNYYEVGPWKQSPLPYEIFDVCTYPNPSSVPCPYP